MASKHLVIIIYIFELIAACILLTNFESLWNNRFLNPKVKIESENRKKLLRLFILMIIRIIVKAVYFYIEFYIREIPVAYLLDMAMDFTYVLSLYFCYDIALYKIGKETSRIKTMLKVCGGIYAFGFLFVSLIWLDPNMGTLIIPKGPAWIAYIASELVAFVPYIITGLYLLYELVSKYRGQEYFIESLVLVLNNLWYVVYVHMWNFSYLDKNLYFLRILKPLDGLHLYMAVLLILFTGVFVRQYRKMTGDMLVQETDHNEILPAENSSREETINDEPDKIQTEEADVIHEEKTHEEFQLTHREEEILSLLVEGKSYQEIADELVISLNTVKRHCSNVYHKCGVKNRNQLSSLINTKNK